MVFVSSPLSLSSSLSLSLPLSFSVAILAQGRAAVGGAPWVATRRRFRLETSWAAGRRVPLRRALGATNTGLFRSPKLSVARDLGALCQHYKGSSCHPRRRARSGAARPIFIYFAESAQRRGHGTYTCSSVLLRPQGVWGI